MRRHVRTHAGIGAALAVALIAGGGVAATAVSPSAGPLGGGEAVTVAVPAAPDAPNFVRISGGNHSSLAIGSDSRVYGWGGNGEDEIGAEEHGSQPIPVRSQTPAGVTFSDVAVGTFTSYAIGSDGETYTWGSGQNGALGDGSNRGRRAVPTAIELPPETAFVHVVAGNEHAFGLDAEGNAFGWGLNLSHQLGDGSSSYQRLTPTPVVMPAGVGFTDLSTLADHSLAVGDDGNTYAWGTNSSGLLGTSSFPRALDRPTQVTTPRGVTYTQVAAGWDFSVALGSDGRLYSWGSNYLGALGNGSTADESRTPVRVATPSGVTFQRVVSGGQHSLALTTDGQVYAWGSNEYGELGDGTVLGLGSGTSTPTLVRAPEGVTFEGISAGQGTSFARGSDGQAYSWGSNSFGQLGDGTRTDLAIPTPVLPPEMRSVVTGVSFGEHPGTALTQGDSGNVTVTTPAGDALGPVDVRVEWTVNGEPQEAVVLPEGYLYGEAPRAAPLRAQEASLGESVSFPAAVTGSPLPELSWEYSWDGGVSWAPIQDDPAITLAADAQSITVVTAAEHQRAWYRVTAANALGSHTSDSAELRIPERTVTFDTAGGKPVPDQVVLSGDVVTTPDADPVRAGFDFAGWVDADGAAFDFAAPVFADTTVFASWTATPVVTFVVDFDLAGGAGEFPAQTVASGATAVPPKQDPTREGFRFTGWTLAGAAYDFAAPVTGDLTLVAGWQGVAVVTHAVTFDPANGNAAFVTRVADGTPVAQPADPTRAGYVFTGWALDGAEYDFGAPVTGALTLTAVWAPVTAPPTTDPPVTDPSTTPPPVAPSPTTLSATGTGPGGLTWGLAGALLVLGGVVLVRARRTAA